MNNLKMFCICLHNNLLQKVKALNYIPVGLGQGNFNENWLRDFGKGDDISSKNQYYGEYTFHYWFWKNMLNEIEDDSWIGFCAYRRFWSKKNIQKKNSINDIALQEVPEEWNDYDTIIGDELNLIGIPWIKALKYGKISLLKNPKVLLKNRGNIKFHFDLHHGNGIIEKAISLLNDNDKNDFKQYINDKTSYNQGNMFICRSKKIINEYYQTIFEWLFKCEKIFGFELYGYSKVRMYGFLAERFLPYWFNKYTKPLIWPIEFYDLSKEK